jgi:hypothetical protein
MVNMSPTHTIERNLWDACAFEFADYRESIAYAASEKARQHVLSLLRWGLGPNHTP